MLLLNFGSYKATGYVPTVDILFCKSVIFLFVVARSVLSSNSLSLARVASASRLSFKVV